MKISEIRIDRTKSLGNYENLKLGFTAVVEEDESPVDAIERVKKLLDWEINKDERETTRSRFEKRLAEIASLETEDAEKERAQIARWMATYNDRKAEIEAMSAI